MTPRSRNWWRESMRTNRSSELPVTKRVLTLVRRRHMFSLPGRLCALAAVPCPEGKFFSSAGSSSGLHPSP